MSELVLLGLAVLSVLVFLLMFRHANRLFFMEVEQGHLVRVKGRVPARLLEQFQQVVRNRPVERAVIEVVTEGGEPSLKVKGDVNDKEKQRLRNILGMWPRAKILAAPLRNQRRPAPKNRSHLRRVS